MKKGLKITFINPNTEEQIVQAMAGVLAYNLAENDDGVIFDYKTSNSYQNFHSNKEKIEEIYWLLVIKKVIMNIIIKIHD